MHIEWSEEKFLKGIVGDKRRLRFWNKHQKIKLLFMQLARYNKMHKRLLKYQKKFQKHWLINQIYQDIKLILYIYSSPAAWAKDLSSQACFRSIASFGDPHCLLRTSPHSIQCAWNSRIWNFEFRKTLLPLRNLWNFAPGKWFRPVRFCTPIKPRPPLPHLAEPCVWLGCSNRHSSALRGSKQSALAAKTDNTPTTVVCVPLRNEGDGCLTTDCKMSIKTTGNNCYSLTATTMPLKSQVRCVACNYRAPAPFALRAHLPCTAAPARTCDLFLFYFVFPFLRPSLPEIKKTRSFAPGVLGSTWDFFLLLCSLIKNRV